MCGKQPSRVELSSNFPQTRSEAYRWLLAALAAASTACAVIASPVASKAQTGGQGDETTLQKKLRTGIELMIDPVAAEPEAENLQAQLASPQSGRLVRPALKLDQHIGGSASTYNPHKPGDRSGGMITASGEPYEANGWAAAIQLDLRSMFRGVRFGRNYRPAFALVTAEEKSVVVKINDVGPLLPGRVIDLTERAMRYFDASLERGLLPDVKVTPLSGDRWRAGPVEGGLALTMAGECLSEEVLH